MGQDSNNLITLGNGDCLPPYPLNWAWRVQVDEFYANNPHLLPPLVQPGHCNPPPHFQANFAANFIEVSQSKLVKNKEVTSTNSLHLAKIMEVTDEDEMVGLNDLDEEYEPRHID